MRGIYDWWVYDLTSWNVDPRERNVFLRKEEVFQSHESVLKMKIGEGWTKDDHINMRKYFRWINEELRGFFTYGTDGICFVCSVIAK